MLDANLALITLFKGVEILLLLISGEKSKPVLRARSYGWWQCLIRENPLPPVATEYQHPVQQPTKLWDPISAFKGDVLKPPPPPAYHQSQKRKEKASKETDD